MKKLILLFLFMSLVWTFPGICRGQELQEKQDVEVKLIPVSSSVEAGIVTMIARIKVVNPFDFPIKKVVTTVKEAVGLTISPTIIEIGNIPANGTAVTDERVTIKYTVPSQGEVNTEQRLLWDVKYSSQGNSKEKSHVLSGIRINEIMFFPAETEPEWVELYNESDGQINITGYHICNALGNVYTIPDKLPPIPAGAFVVIVFDGESSSIDDLSFADDSLATLYADQKNVFDDKGDVCALFADIPYKVKTIRGFVAWGDTDRKEKGASFLRYAKAKKLWTDNAGRVFTEVPKFIGPAPIVQKGGSLVLLGSGGLKSLPTAVPCRPEEVTPGANNTLPEPQLRMPCHQLETSANHFTFSWLPVGSAEYEIQICRDKLCEDIVVYEAGLTEPNFRPASPLERYVTYYWRVRAVKGDLVSGWGEVRTFTIAYPEEIGSTPGEGAFIIGQPNPLGVQSRPARKDSTMLCIDGCDKNHWDKSNAASSSYIHASWYCWAAGAQMLAWYRGGTVLQDEIVATVKGNITSAPQPSPALPHGITPENSLPHGSHAGAYMSELRHALRFALQTTNTQLHEHASKPTAAELRNYIDNDTPVYYCNAGHVMIVDGYRTVGGIFQGRFLNTDNNGTIAWRSWANETFWGLFAPDTTLVGKTKDARLDTDTDADSMNDFDEDERFPTDKAYADTEWDGVYDKADVASYALRGISADIDSDGLRAEIDPDSDGGGLRDGLEDLDNDGEYEPGDGETDPHNSSDDSGADLDLVLLIDTTGSMTDDIAAAKAAAVAIVNSIAANAGDWRVAVVSFEDFPVDPYGDAACGDFMYHDVLNFTNNQTNIVNAINALTLRCGLDWPESHYSALMHVLDKNALGGWRDGVGKAVILMSDAPPHDPEPTITGYTAYTKNDVITAAINLDPAVIYPVVIGGDTVAETLLGYLADETGGALFEAEGAEDIVDTIIEAVEAVFSAPIAVAGGPYSACIDIPMTFDAGASYDTNGTIVLYEWDFENDGTYDIEVTDPTTTHTYSSEYTGFVSLRVTDNDGLTDTDTASVEVGDIVPPVVDIDIPVMGEAVQDGITFTVEATDNCEVADVHLTLQATNGTDIIETILQDEPATYNGSTGKWELYYDTLQVDDGNYLLSATAVDGNGNPGYSQVVAFSIRNWAVLELLPASAEYRAGRTMPVKFSLRICEALDPAKPFVRNEELAIKIKKGDTVLQESVYGVTATDYRIDDIGEHYITNFKTPKKPAIFTVEVWRTRANFLLGAFEFETVRK